MSYGNIERFAVSATKKHLIDFNSYCVNPNASCLEDSFRLINTLYNSALDVIVSDTIGFNDNINLSRPIYIDSLISTSTYGDVSNAINPKVVWFNEHLQDFGFKEFSAFDLSSPYPSFLGIRDSLFYFFRKEPVGLDDQYLFEVYNDQQILNSFSIDTVSNDSILNIYSFTEDSDGNFYFIVVRAGIDIVMKVSPNFELVWKTFINIPNFGPFNRREFLKVDGYLNNVYIYSQSNTDLTVKVFNSQTGEILNDITLITFSPFGGTPSLFPLEINGELWYYNT